MAKPLTKALHTVRVFSQLAPLLRINDRTEQPATIIYTRILALLGNTDTSDATLRAACIKACEAAPIRDSRQRSDHSNHAHIRRGADL